MKIRKRKNTKERGVQLSLFADQHTTVNEMGEKIKPTMLDKVLSGKARNNTNHMCIYKSETECLVSKYIWEERLECVLLPDICNCNEACPYFTKPKEDK